jgi:hypothetical protein
MFHSNQQQPNYAYAYPSAEPNREANHFPGQYAGQYAYPQFQQAQAPAPQTRIVQQLTTRGAVTPSEVEVDMSPYVPNSALFIPQAPKPFQCEHASRIPFLALANPPNLSRHHRRLRQKVQAADGDHQPPLREAQGADAGRQPGKAVQMRTERL